MEETGCKVRLDGKCIATVKEWRNDLHQVSYCYIAQLVKDTGAPALTDEEKAEGLRHEWVCVEAALGNMKEIQPTFELGRFIKERDIFFLEEFAKSA
jgi:8-oxo-dGTP diphosphatase